jgi:hypothetical protein
MSKEIFKMEDVNAQAKKNREQEYKASTDALFFKVQRGEAQMSEWLDAVAKVKAKYPYVDADVEIEV